MDKRYVCLPVNVSESALYIESYLNEDQCTYQLNDYFGDNSNNYFYFENGKGYIGATGTKNSEHLLFSFDEPIGALRNIKINSGDWINGEGGTMKLRNVEVKKVNQCKSRDEQIIHFRLKANIHYIENVGLLDINLIFSDIQGFTGTFLTNINEPNIILSVDGEIYDKCLGLDSFERWVIK